MRPLLQRHRCRACGSDLLELLGSGEQAWECGACGLAGGRELVAVRWRRWAENPPTDDPQVRWKTAINSLRRAQMLLLMLRWGCDRYRDDPRVFGIRLSILVWSSKCVREAAWLLGGWLDISGDERWDLWELEAVLDSDLRVLTGEAASVFASHETYLEALVERHLASVQMLVDRCEHLSEPPRGLP